MSSWEGKKIIISGASRGIGAELARQLGQFSVQLMLLARNKDDLDRVASEITTAGTSTATLPCDLSQEAECDRAILESVQSLGGVDVLILNAGINMETVLFGSGTSRAEVRRLVDVNLLSYIFMVQTALPHLKPGSQIVVLSSLQGKTGFPGSTVYSATKHALQGFFDSLRIELLSRRIDVTIICPGAVESNIRSGKEFNSSMLMSTAECARRIVRAIEKRRREEVMTFAGKLGVFLKPLFPGLVDSLVDKAVKKFYAKSPQSVPFAQGG